ncbi:MAG: DUF559 domain-containing protein [Planctomycetes bacterium]|nr:DUF559 domain-containing protein [Planctomycetota bacterium]
MHPMRLDRARTLRDRSSIPERVLWGMLRDRRVAGLKFRRQHPIGPYVADFFCESARLVVELDGESHTGCGEQDDQRTAFIERESYRVIRFTVDELLQSPDAVAETIARAAGIQM